jgi:hypothetical protein
VAGIIIEAISANTIATLPRAFNARLPKFIFISSLRCFNLRNFSLRTLDLFSNLRISNLP